MGGREDFLSKIIKIILVKIDFWGILNSRDKEGIIRQTKIRLSQGDYSHKAEKQKELIYRNLPKMF
jgi:hypothetical protein